VAVAAFAAAGARAGDRIEHAAVAPPEVAAELARLPLTVVTQPNFVRERGDAYLAEVESRDLPWLYRCRGWLDAGVSLGGGTDAPFGHADPWRAMAAAVDRASESGARLAPEEALSPERALALFTTHPSDPGGPPRAVAEGAAADLCLLDAPWREVRRALSSRHVRASFRAGEVIHGTGEL
jgi:predicted amidohydrolase YtcJ